MIKKILNRFLNRIGKRALLPALEDFDSMNRSSPIDAAAQTALWVNYKLLTDEARAKLSFRDVGWKAHSQTDEDGILLFLLATLGATTRRCVEICASDGRECNTANLLLNHHFSALLVDGDPSHVEHGRLWYAQHPSTYVHPPKFLCEWVTAENINSLLETNGYRGEIDVLSIDVDGVDYWLWKAIDIVQPRIVLIEFQCHLGPERSWTVPYKPDFRADQFPMTNGWLPSFAGASLPALTKLAEEKGYRLVGCNALGFNAFFVRNDLGQEFLPSVSVESCLQHERVLWSMKERFPVAKDFGWQEV
ncbi:MAG: FkbM family methyltransferase [Fuerstiella sp.]|nr:FkbM family methyltransferase [Fuerstiella sp.]MCP4508786.1 FkbM family methyltransferase [Fuerstiella sp.]